MVAVEHASEFQNSWYFLSYGTFLNFKEFLVKYHKNTYSSDNINSFKNLDFPSSSMIFKDKCQIWIYLADENLVKKHHQNMSYLTQILYIEKWTFAPNINCATNSLKCVYNLKSTANIFYLSPHLDQNWPSY